MTTIKEHRKETFEEVTACHHHWVIDAPNGPTSRGMCKRCGAVKEFYNSTPGAFGVWARSSQGNQPKANDKTYKPREAEESLEPDDELVNTEPDEDDIPVQD